MIFLTLGVAKWLNLSVVVGDAQGLFQNGYKSKMDVGFVVVWEKYMIKVSSETVFMLIEEAEMLKQKAAMLQMILEADDLPESVFEYIDQLENEDE